MYADLSQSQIKDDWFFTLQHTGWQWTHWKAESEVNTLKRIQHTETQWATDVQYYYPPQAVHETRNLVLCSFADSHQNMPIKVRMMSKDFSHTPTNWISVNTLTGNEPSDFEVRHRFECHLRSVVPHNLYAVNYVTVSELVNTYRRDCYEICYEPFKGWKPIILHA